MSFVEQLRAEMIANRAEDIAWKLKVENDVASRHSASLAVQFLIAIAGGVVALIGSKLLPF